MSEENTNNEEKKTAAQEAGEQAAQDLDYSQGFNFLRLFIVPGFIAAGLVAVYLLIQLGFGRIGSEKQMTAQETLQQVQQGSSRVQAQAATELARAIARDLDTLEKDEAFKQELLNTFLDKERLPDKVRASLAYSLYLVPAEGVNEALLSALGPDETPAVRYHATIVVGNMKLTEAVGTLRDNLKEETPELRTAALLALGNLQAKEAQEEMRLSLQDPEISVRWAAAGALSQLQDPSGMDILQAMLVQETYNGLGFSKEEMMANMGNALQALCVLDTEEARQEIKRVSTAEGFDESVRAKARSCPSMQQAQ